MTENVKEIYDTVYSNSILFLNRGITEVLSHNNLLDEALDRETGIISSLFTQMSIELALKAYLIKEKGIKSILLDKYKNKTEPEIYTAFLKNSLHTKQYNDLKIIIIKNKTQIFSDDDFLQLDQFQQFRNLIVHLNLKLADADLFDLKYEIIYVMVHIIIPLLTKINLEFESPTSFYDKYLNKSAYQKLISYEPYVSEMEKLAINCSGISYSCPVCRKKTFSPDNNLCYCCNLNLEYAVEYTDCLKCKNKNSVIFDHLNIEQNHNVMDGQCLHCDSRIKVLKCPKCGNTYTFLDKQELTKCTPDKCYFY